MNIIIAPVITEKSESLKENNVYVFKVKKSANKTQIKNEVEKAFWCEFAKKQVKLLRKESKNARNS